MVIQTKKNELATQSPLGNRGRKSFHDGTLNAKTEKAQLETKTTFIRFIGSKLEKGEIAKVVAGPRNKRIVEIRLSVITFLIDED